MAVVVGVSAGILLLSPVMTRAASASVPSLTQGTLKGLPTTGVLSAEACPTASSCLAVGNNNSTPGGLVVPVTAAGVPGAARIVSGAKDLLGVACATATRCVALGESTSATGGAVLPLSADGTPGTAGAVTGTLELIGVACPSATSCIAIGLTEGGATVVVPISAAGVPGTAKTVSGVYLSAIACPSATKCLAVGYNTTSDVGVVVPIAADGAPGAAKSVSGGTALFGVACAGASGCVGVGFQVVPIAADGTPGTPATAPGGDHLTGVACATASHCVAAGVNTSSSGSSAVVTLAVDGTAGTSTPVNEPELLEVACATSTQCSAVGAGSFPDGGVVVPVAADGTPGSAHTVLSVDQFNAAACPSTTSCVSVGDGGDDDFGPDEFGVVVTVAADGTPSQPQLAFGTFELTGVACPSASTCVAVGNNGSEGVVVSVSAAGVPGAVTPVSGTVSLSSVACPSASACVAVGNDGSEGVVVPVSAAGVPGAATGVGGTVSLGGVACPSASACVAAGNNSSEGVVVPVPAAGVPGAATAVSGTTALSGVACATPSACVAVGYQTPSGAPTEGVTVSVSPDGSPGTAATITGDPAADNGLELTSVACPNSTSCAAAGWYFGEAGPGALVPVAADGTPGPVQANAQADGGLFGLACSTASSCFALASPASVLPVTVTPGPEGLTPTTSVTCAPDPVAAGTASTCTATVSDSAGGTPVPTGTVAFSSLAAGPLAPCTLVGDPASCAVSYTPAAAGTDTISATYSGDETYTSSSDTTSLTVTAAGGGGGGGGTGGGGSGGGGGGGGGSGGAGSAITGVPVNTGLPAITGSATAGNSLSCSTGTWTNSPSSFTYQWSRDGTPIQGATNSAYTVQKSDEQLTLTCAVTASNSLGAGSPATSPGVAVAVPHVARCPAATRTLSGRSLGLVRLGMTRTQARRAYKHSSNRGKKYQDFFCLTPIGVRVGYGSPKLPKQERKRLRNRVIWASTSSAYYAIHGIRAGATITAAGKALRTGKPIQVGRNTWYLAPNGSSTAVLKVRRGIVEEIGIGDKQLTHGHKAQVAFLKSFS